MYKIIVFLAAVLALSELGIANAQTICANASLKGYYGVQISGTRPAPSVLNGLQGTPGTTEQVVGVVIQIFDGAGGFTQTDNVKGSLSGITPDRPGSGTYSVNADCTGTYTVNNAGSPPIVNRFVLADNGQTLLTAVVSPQAVMVTSTGKKMDYLAACPVNGAPVLAAATDANNTSNIAANGTIVVWGQGFTPSGGNSLVFQRAGLPDVVMNEASGTFFWDYSASQINAALSSALTPGTWTLTARSACSGSPSNSLSVTVR